MRRLISLTTEPGHEMQDAFDRDALREARTAALRRADWLRQISLGVDTEEHSQDLLDDAAVYQKLADAIGAAVFGQSIEA